MPVPRGQPCLCKQGINKWLMLKLNNHRGIFLKMGPPVDIMAVQCVGSLWPIQTYFSIFVEFVFKFICKIYISNIFIHFRNYKTKCLKIKMMVIFSDMEMLGSRAGRGSVWEEGWNLVFMLCVSLVMGTLPMLLHLILIKAESHTCVHFVVRYVSNRNSSLLVTNMPLIVYYNIWW